MNSSIYGNKTREFFAWWSAELAGMLPASKSVSGKSTQRGLLIRLDNKSSTFQWEERSREEPIASKFDSESALKKYNAAVEQDKKLAVKACSIQLPNKKILRRSITLPASTEENLLNVVSYEMDRYTPFARDDVYFDVKIQDRNQKEQKITVALSVIKKSVVDEIIKFASASSMSIQSVFTKVDGKVEHFSFIKDQEQGSSQRKPSKVNKYLSTLALLLAITALALPIAKNYLQAEQYKSELLILQEEVDQVRQLQSEYKLIKQDVDFITRQSRHSMRVLDLLNDLSRIVPDDTYLSRLVLEQGVVRIRGNSAAASKLISIIDSSPQFIDVRFVAPVTQNNRTGLENFTIEFQLQSGERNVAISE